MPKKSELTLQKKREKKAQTKNNRLLPSLNELTQDVVLPTSVNKKFHKEHKKHIRRSNDELKKDYICPFAGCNKAFGWEGSLSLHMKLKHNGGNKT